MREYTISETLELLGTHIPKIDLTYLSRLIGREILTPCIWYQGILSVAYHYDMNAEARSLGTNAVSLSYIRDSTDFPLYLNLGQQQFKGWLVPKDKSLVNNIIYNQTSGFFSKFDVHIQRLMHDIYYSQSLDEAKEFTLLSHYEATSESNYVNYDSEKGIELFSSDFVFLDPEIQKIINNLNNRDIQSIEDNNLKAESIKPNGDVGLESESLDSNVTDQASKYLSIIASLLKYFIDKSRLVDRKTKKTIKNSQAALIEALEDYFENTTYIVKETLKKTFADANKILKNELPNTIVSSTYIDRLQKTIRACVTLATDHVKVIPHTTKVPVTDTVSLAKAIIECEFPHLDITETELEEILKS